MFKPSQMLLEYLNIVNVVRTTKKTHYLPGNSFLKSACQSRDTGSIPGPEDPARLRATKPSHDSCPRGLALQQGKRPHEQPTGHDSRAARTQAAANTQHSRRESANQEKKAPLIALSIAEIVLSCLLRWFIQSLGRPGIQSSSIYLLQSYVIRLCARW